VTSNRTVTEPRMTLPPVVQRSNAHAPKTVTQRHDQRTSFDQKLRDAEQKDVKKQDENAKSSESEGAEDLPNDMKLLGDDTGGSSGEGFGQGDASSLAVLAQQARFDAKVQGIQSAQNVALSEAQIAHLEKISAIISSAVKGGAQDVYTVDLKGMESIAQSAVISRDGAGLISINLVTPNQAIPQHGLILMRQQLMDRLEKRKLTVKSVEFDGKKDDAAVASKGRG
jgi:hypothetical protein